MFVVWYRAARCVCAGCGYRGAEVRPDLAAASGLNLERSLANAYFAKGKAPPAYVCAITDSRPDASVSGEMRRA